MDELEKKIRNMYQGQKNEDEKQMPAFDHFPKSEKPLIRPVQKLLFLKLAASFLGAALISYYFFGTGSRPEKPIPLQSVNLNIALPSQSLLDKRFETGYIWNWKAPTDKLLEDANKLFKPRT